MSETAKQSLSLWVEEVHQETLGMRFRVKRTLFSGESEFQQIDIVETESHGRMLFNDGVAMLSERDEFVYHEMIAHVPLFLHPAVERALIIGGGDGGTAREIIRHPSVKHCRLVEIDPLVLEGCRAHIPQTAAALDDPRVEVSVADGVAFAAETDERYDLIAIDSTDPIGPATPLFGPDFYRNIKRILRPGGIVVSQAESPFYEVERQRSLGGILKDLFGRVHFYNYVNLTYPGGLWSFSYATDADLCPLAALDDRRIAEAALSLRYYNADVHRAAFVLPQFQAHDLADCLTPLPDLRSR